MRHADTDVRRQRDEATHENPSTRSGGGLPRTPPPAVGRDEDWVGELLGEWQATELRVARGFAECRGLAGEQLEDIYQETALALLNRPYGSEEHLRNALRHGIKHRALNMHRDTRRRTQILQQSAPSMQRIAEGRASHAAPEEAALADQDRLIVREFIAELDELEQKVFWLIADGMRYRAIAPMLGVPVNVARNASRSCERKRERFQLLYDTGRLCGYRAATIQALQAGELTDDELTRRAFAHLDACVQCRAEHKTNSRRLGRTFQDQLAVQLPMPALLGGVSWLRRACIRAGSHLGSGVRGRAATFVGAGGGTKLAAGVATVAVIAGGTVGATHALGHRAARRPSRATKPMPASTEGLVTKAVVPQGDLAVRGPSGQPKRARHSVYLARRRDQPAKGSTGATRETAGREFSPEGPTSTAVAPEPVASNSGDASQERAEREFGISAAGG